MDVLVWVRTISYVSNPTSEFPSEHSPIRDGAISKFGTLKRVSVDENCRKLGIAKKLLGTVIDHVASFPRSEIDAIVLETSEFQPAAIAFYERFGFKLERVERMAILSGLESWIPGPSYTRRHYRWCLPNNP